jgi:hypothetical protein
MTPLSPFQASTPHGHQARALALDYPIPTFNGAHLHLVVRWRVRAFLEILSKKGESKI